MDNIDKIIKDVLNEEINISEEFDNIILHSLDNNKTPNEYINFKRILQLVATMLIVFIGIGSYAYNESIKSNKLEQTISEVNNKISVNTYYDENGIEKKEYHFEGFFDTDEWNSYNMCKFLIIMNIDEYNMHKEEYKDKFELAEMTEKDFENKYLLLIKTFGDACISDVKEEGEILYIDIERDFNENNDYIDAQKVISIKLDKKLVDREIKINTYPALDNYSIKPTIKELVEYNYTKEQAIQDGYIVTETIGTDVHLISNNIEKFNNFIEETQNGKEMEIRLIHYSTNITRFIDIKYEDNYYKSYIYEKESPHKMLGEIEVIISDSQYFKKGKEIKKVYYEKENSYRYELIEETILKVGDMERVQEEAYPILEYNVK